MNIAVVGNGNIARFHVEALRQLGINPSHLVVRDNSSTGAAFGRDHQIDSVVEMSVMDWAGSKIDGVILCCPIECLGHYIVELSSQSIPVLAEKPILLGDRGWDKLGTHENVFVAFNRRTYPTVQQLKLEVEKLDNYFVELHLPEQLVKTPGVNPLHRVFSNSCHGVDLIHYLFGEFEISSITKTASGEHDRIVLGQLAKGKVQINFLFGMPINFQINVYSSGTLLALKPFEALTKYSSMSFVDASKEMPVATYQPSADWSMNAFDADLPNTKPGFVEQLRQFLGFVRDRSNVTSLATIEEARKAQLKICEIFGSYEQ